MFPDQELCGARGKRRGFSPAATARHSKSARVHTDSRQKKISQKFQVEPAQPEMRANSAAKFALNRMER